MKNKLSTLNRFLMFILISLGMSFILTTIANAAVVYSCSENGKRCIAKLETGSVGDKVTVLDNKANRVGEGRIIKKKGSFGVIILFEITQKIRRGFPVIINNDSKNSNLEWAATFSYKD